MPRPIQAFVHSDALRHNLQRMKDCTPDARVWAVVKANAYGHGIENAYEGLRGCDGFALLDLNEAQRVRDVGWRGPILLLEGVFEVRDLELCSRLNLWHTVHCNAQIDMLSQHKTQQAHRVFLKLNSGMNRLGFAPDAFRSAWTRLNQLPQVDEISLMTHFVMQTVLPALPHKCKCLRKQRKICQANAVPVIAPPYCAMARMPMWRLTGCAQVLRFMVDRQTFRSIPLPIGSCSPL